MIGDLQAGFRVGNWTVYPQENRLQGHDGVSVLEPKVMDLLVFLAGRQNDVLSREELLDSVWPDVVVGDETLSRAISLLRAELGDDLKNPRYLATISKRGYRFIGEVVPLAQPQGEVTWTRNGTATEGPSRNRLLFVISAFVLLFAVVLFLAREPTGYRDVADARPNAASIAVLPFRNRSGVAEDVYFIDGIHSDILTQLAKLASFDSVISRTSVEQYRDTSKTVRQIGRELRVAHVLEGTVQRAGGQIHINVQLIDATDDKHLWAEQYDRELTVENLFAVQREIAQEIAEALQIAVTDQDIDRWKTLPTWNLDAYREYVLGHQEMVKATGDALDRAEAHFKRAIELDPDYALAYVGLADTYLYMAEFADLPRDESLQLRLPLVEQALELDPMSGEAYASLATIRAHQMYLPDAERLVQKALELSPNYATAHQWHAMEMARQGRYEEALEIVGKALELDPMAPMHHYNRTRLLWELERYDEAQAALVENIERHPHFAGNYQFMAGELLDQGRVGEAMHWIYTAERRIPNEFNLARMQCFLYLELNDDTSAEPCFELLIENFPAKGWGWALDLHRFRSDFLTTAEMSERLAEKYPTTNVRTKLAWDYVNNGDIDRARSVHDQLAPRFYSEADINVDPARLWRVLLAAYILQLDGRIDRANYLFEQALDTDWTQQDTRAPAYETWIVFVHVARGDKQEAVDALRDAIDTGWRELWWCLRFPAFAPMQEEPEWNALMEELVADINQQRQWFEAHKDDPLF